MMKPLHRRKLQYFQAMDEEPYIGHNSSICSKLYRFDKQPEETMGVSIPC
jgi:hypothetical protein